MMEKSLQMSCPTQNEYPEMALSHPKDTLGKAGFTNGIAKVAKRKVLPQWGSNPAGNCPVSSPSQRSNPLEYRAPHSHLIRTRSTHTFHTFGYF